METVGYDIIKRKTVSVGTGISRPTFIPTCKVKKFNSNCHALSYEQALCPLNSS